MQIQLNGNNYPLSFPLKNNIKTVKDLLDSMEMPLPEDKHDIRTSVNGKVSLHDPVRKFFPCRWKDVEAEILFNVILNEFEVDALKDYTSVANSIGKGASFLVDEITYIRRRHECNPALAYIYIGCPSFSGKSQLAITLDTFSKFPARFDAIQRPQTDQSSLFCVIHMNVEPSCSNPQPIYGYTRELSASFVNALIADYDLLGQLYQPFEERKLCSAEKISMSSIMRCRDTKFKSLGIISHLLQLRREQDTMKLAESRHETCPMKTLNELKAEIMTKCGALPVVVVLDEFQIGGETRKFLDAAFMCRNMLQLCHIVVIVMGTDSRASNQVSYPYTGYNSRIGDELPWVYIFNQLPNATPESIQSQMVLHRVSEPTENLKELFANFENWNRLLTDLCCPQEIVDWLLKTTPNGDFAHCTRPGVVVNFLACLVKILDETDEEEAAMDAGVILERSLQKLKSMLYRYKPKLNSASLGHYYTYFDAYRLPFNSSYDLNAANVRQVDGCTWEGPKPVPDCLIDEHLAYLLNPTSATQHSTLQRPVPFSLSRSEKRIDRLMDSKSKEFEPAGFFPAFQEDELTNLALLMPGSKFSFEEMTIAKRRKEAKCLPRENTQQPAKNDGSRREGLLMGSFIKASWRAGFQGQKMGSFLSFFFEELGLERLEIDESGIIGGLLDIDFPIIAPADTDFSDEFKAIVGGKAGRMNCSKDSTCIDGHAFIAQSKVLSILESKDQKHSTDYGKAKIIDSKTRKFQVKTYDDVDWRITFLLTNKITSKDETEIEFDNDTVVYKVRKARGSYSLAQVSGGVKRDRVASGIPDAYKADVKGEDEDDDLEDHDDQIYEDDESYSDEVDDDESGFDEDDKVCNAIARHQVMIIIPLHDLRTVHVQIVEPAAKRANKYV